MASKFIVSLYYNMSETTYCFGPMTFEQSQKFNDMLKEKDPNCEKYGEANWQIINDPKLFGTGNEMSRLGNNLSDQIEEWE